mmetsp:Transcript_80811/g.142524  ORF Transcript_80811/g.142524 Transcript_80811/m.142524 type:complete len:239 (-) Transcript_80811:110-826(-)
MSLEANADAGQTEQAQLQRPSSALADLAAVRQKHHERFRQREEEEERHRLALEQENNDAELAAQFAREEEEERLRQLAEDEELSRQLAEELGGAGQPMQDFTPANSSPGLSADPGGNQELLSRPSFNSGPVTGGASNPSMSQMEEDDLAAQYQQMEDGEAEGYRAPMRTGYMDRLIDSPQDLTWTLSMFRGGVPDAREPMLLDNQDTQTAAFQWSTVGVRLITFACLLGLGIILSNSR